jgi:hypothetical protein
VVDVDEGTTWQEDEAHSDEEVTEEKVKKRMTKVVIWM